MIPLIKALPISSDQSSHLYNTTMLVTNRCSIREAVALAVSTWKPYQSRKPLTTRRAFTMRLPSIIFHFKTQRPEIKFLAQARGSGIKASRSTQALNSFVFASITSETNYFSSSFVKICKSRSTRKCHLLCCEDQRATRLPPSW